MRAPDLVEAPYDYAYCVDCQYCTAQTPVAYDKEPNVPRFTRGQSLRVKCIRCSTWGIYPPEAVYSVKMWRGH